METANMQVKQIATEFDMHLMFSKSESLLLVDNCWDNHVQSWIKLNVTQNGKNRNQM